MQHAKLKKIITVWTAQQQCVVGAVYEEPVKTLAGGNPLMLHDPVLVAMEGEALRTQALSEGVLYPQASIHAIMDASDKLLRAYRKHHNIATQAELTTDVVVPEHVRSALVIYHGHCADGACAGWIAESALTSLGLDVTCWPMGYGTDPPWDLIESNDLVYIVDFSLEETDLEKINEMGKMGRVIDHHKSRADFLQSRDYATFDLERSGAGLTWDFFYAQYPRPWFVNLVEDRDLWRFSLPASRNFQLYVLAHQFERGLFTSFANRYGLGDAVPEDIVSACDLLAMQRDHNVDQAVRSAIDMRLQHSYPDDYLDVMCAYVTANHSEVGHALIDSEVYPVSLTWRYKKGGTHVSLSFRSDGSVDVSEWAKARGGGGHTAAAGCTLEAHVWEAALQKRVILW